MRTDCKIDNRVVIARNATLLGYATRKVKAGTYVVFRDSRGNERMARSLGRVTAHDLPPSGFVLAMVWFPMGHCAVRWIDPADINEAYDSPPHRLAELFFAPSLPYDAKTMVRLMEHGTLSEQYVENHATRVAIFQERDKLAKESTT